jgi:hypothetical protein
MTKHAANLFARRRRATAARALLRVELPRAAGNTAAPFIANFHPMKT